MKHRPASRRFHQTAWAIVAFLASGFPAPMGVSAQESGSRVKMDLGMKADAIRASADKLAKVQRIPWVTDIEEGFRLAKEERRPVLLYMITGDPLGDC